jgi:regulator of protease activity HflC (stomatin/prohibitin superfamily)
MPKILWTPILLGVAAVFALVILRMGFYTVDTGELGVILRYGQVMGIAQPGPHLKIPLVDTVATVSTRTRWIDWRDSGVMQTYSRDQQPAELTVRVSYHIKPDSESVKALYAQYGTVQSYETAVIQPRATQEIKTTFGQFNAVTAVQERQDLNAKAQAAVVSAIEKAAGANKIEPGAIEGVEIQNIDFSKTYEDSIEARMQAQVEVEKVNQNLEREKAQAQIRVVQAQAEADAVRLKGEAEAAAINARGKALRDNPDLVSLNAVEKWDGHLPTTMPPGTAVPFIQLPAGQAEGRK